MRAIIVRGLIALCILAIYSAALMFLIDVTDFALTATALIPPDWSGHVVSLVTALTVAKTAGRVIHAVRFGVTTGDFLIRPRRRRR